MNKRKIVTLLSLVIIIVLLIFAFVFLAHNKTFFKNTYIGTSGQEIFIPKYSYFKSECCFTSATFYSLRSEESLKKEINDYLNEFEYFEDESTYGYKKENLFIQKYEVENKGIVRKIIITY